MLRKFGEQVAINGSGAANTPPFVIRASDLDKNFGLCYPMPQEGNNTAFSVVRSSDDGWRLVGNALLDVCENGTPVRYRVFAEKVIESG
jgi:hypothetical protein